MRGAANRHPRAPQPISNGWGGAMTSPVLLSYPSPTRLLVLVARVEKFGGGDGKRSSDVTFPLCHWLSGGRTTTNQQSQKVWRGPAESPVATRKRNRERTSGCIVRCSVGYARGLGRCGQVNSKILILGRRTFLIAPSHPQTWVGA